MEDARPVQAPFEDDGMDGSIGIRRFDHQGCVVLSLAGRLDLAAAPKVQAAILLELAEQPPAIICDLGQVEALDPVCAGVFTSIRHPALGWPGTALALCALRPAVADTLRQLRLTHHLTIHPSLDEALRNTCARPSALREHLTLRPVPTAAGAGRDFIRKLCGRWGVQELADPAVLLASELVTNAVAHAGTTMELRVELRDRRLYLAVSDQDPNLRRLLAARQGVDRGRGLLILDQVAAAWGVRRNGAGKVVWCTLELPAGQPSETMMTGSCRASAAPRRPWR
jgi:anti-anti-sigma factor